MVSKTGRKPERVARIDRWRHRMNLTNIVTVTTVMDENTDHEVVVIYSRTRLSDWR